MTNLFSGNVFVPFEGFLDFKNWPMTSLHFWGEGVSSQNHGSLWKLVVRNSGDETATLEGWQLRFYGTHQQPQPGNFVIPSQIISVTPYKFGT